MHSVATKNVGMNNTPAASPPPCRRKTEVSGEWRLAEAAPLAIIRGGFRR
jgi:hypothetical protein